MAKMGSGSHVYEVVDGWLQLPEDITLGYTHGIVVDKQDDVYIFHTGSPAILHFSSEGVFKKAWGEEFAGGAHGFYLHQEADQEYLYVTDIERGLMVKMTLDGEQVLTIGTPPLPDVYDEERKYVPTDVAVAPNGDIYLADGYGQSYVHQYTAKGEYIRSWGGTAEGPDQMVCPHGISVDLRKGEPELYIADRGNHRIKVYTMDGQLKRIIDENMDAPCNFYFHGDEMYFPDLHSRVTIFDAQDTLITHLGENQQAYKTPGWPNLDPSQFRDNRFSSPHGMCVDSKGDVYVAEWTIHGRINKLKRV